MSARPMASICCSPPDSVPATWVMRSSQAREQREHALQVGGDAAVGAQERAHHEVLAARSGG